MEWLDASYFARDNCYEAPGGEPSTSMNSCPYFNVSTEKRTLMVRKMIMKLFSFEEVSFVDPI